MTKRNIFKRAASLLLALIIVFSAGVSIVFADAKADSYKYPCIFVHGILGYGDSDKLNSVTPYWGMQYKEDLMKSLNARGYDCHAASVGPSSITVQPTLRSIIMSATAVRLSAKLLSTPSARPTRTEISSR